MKSRSLFTAVWMQRSGSASLSISTSSQEAGEVLRRQTFAFKLCVASHGECLFVLSFPVSFVVVDIVCGELVIRSCQSSGEIWDSERRT